MTRTAPRRRAPSRTRDGSRRPGLAAAPLLEAEVMRMADRGRCSALAGSPAFQPDLTRPGRSRALTPDGQLPGGLSADLPCVPPPKRCCRRTSLGLVCSRGRPAAPRPGLSLLTLEPDTLVLSTLKPGDGDECILRCSTRPTNRSTPPSPSAFPWLGSVPATGRISGRRRRRASTARRCASVRPHAPTHDRGHATP